MSKIRYIFNTSGEYKAFIYGSNVFDPNCNWIGFIINGNEVYDPKTQIFMGYILDDDRIVKKINDAQKFKPFKPFTPFRPFQPFKPFNRLKMVSLPYPYVDIFQ